MCINKKYINEVAEFTSGSEATGDESWGTWRLKKETLRDYSKLADVEIKIITYAVIIYQSVLMHH